MVDMVASTAVILSQSPFGKQELVTQLIPSERFWLWLPIYQFLTLILFVLFSFRIEEFSLRRDHQSFRRQRPIIVLFSILVLASGLLAMVIIQSTYSGSFDYAILAVFGFYILFAGLIAPPRQVEVAAEMRLDRNL